MKNGNLRTIAIGHVVATVIVQGAIFYLMKSNAVDDTDKKEDQNKSQIEKDKLSTTVATDIQENAPPCPSIESARSTSSTSTKLSITESADTETPKKEETAEEGLASKVTGLLVLSPGQQIMLVGAASLAKYIIVDRANNGTGWQRETRDSFGLFGFLYGLLLIINVVVILMYLSQGATRVQDKESVNIKEREKRRAAEATKARTAFLFAVGVLAGLVSDWCRYFVLAAAAKDTHGLAHLGQISNLSLIVLTLSKLFVFAC
ncbi:uncharacterized protein ColSpa_05485 [Colletotrichum spaethianum]|uniref:Uncharacterized protein n=1 Tax=Colletotrichum spaethianum TaxID=700344 RepID=A0AA37P7R6_9PEZI|nr:uncharacterized protein ColSpa_05485 [Colletotrichum spaethianum]GKT45304.1 hypothetical protein ColSpa_05485 [Colletotrichum spaethianum]